MIVHYNNKEINVEVTKNNTHIVDSYKIKSRKDMRNILELICHKMAANKCMSEADVKKQAAEAIFRISIKTMVHEWRAHNLLYALRIARKRTKDVDLNENKWYVRVAYFVLSLMYWRV